MNGRATAFAPATIGNVGPGFDVLGLAVEGLGDEVTVQLHDAASDSIDEIAGRDAALVPTDPRQNAAAIAARALLVRAGASESFRMRLHKGLPLSGGLGGSAASSVGGALAAAGALGLDPLQRRDWILEAALAGEAAVAGRHLDNIAPCLLGGLALVRSVDPIDLVAVPVKADWWLALVSPNARLETKAARAILPKQWEREGWVGQMANTAALMWAFAQGDAELARRSLDDRFAEPRRAALIPHFAEVKRAAMDAGALGCSISGAGPTVFALAADRAVARACAEAMNDAFAEIRGAAHVGQVAKTGARLT
jgi:homoserine kinase